MDAIKSSLFVDDAVLFVGNLDGSRKTARLTKCCLFCEISGYKRNIKKKSAVFLYKQLFKKIKKVIPCATTS